ncbi:1048_t:CDS:2, partial [Entrophospora sp. SA101]
MLGLKHPWEAHGHHHGHHLPIKDSILLNEEKKNSSPMDLDKSFLVTNDSLSRDDYVSLSQDVFDSTFQNASNVYPQDILDHSSVNTIDQTNMAEL